ncbi:MAG TPA: hypothetical protein VHX44_16490 [Planctomycetota bacterium]|jgi:hypothetical protein|nr:hypothetical protein [Planctomycetota bacterium]
MAKARLPLSLQRLLVVLLLLASWSWGGDQSASPTVPATTPAIAPTATLPFSVDLTASANAVNVGESLTVVVTYRWPAGWTVVAPDGEPDPAKDFANAFVTNLPPPQKQSSGQEERRVYTITLSATRDGAWELPRPTLTVKTPEGTRSVVAPTALVQVGAEDKPAELPPARKAWTRAQGPADNERAWWVLGVALVAIAGLVALVLARRRQQEATRTPWELFYEDWQAASTAADGKEAGARLSLALRRCLGTVFRFDGPAATTRETATFLRGRLPDDEHRELIRLLESLDALRWAPEHLPPSAVRPLAEQGRAWNGALKRRLDAEAEAVRQAKSSGTRDTTQHNVGKESA